MQVYPHSMKGFVLLIISLYIFSCTKEVIEPQKSEKPIFILKIVASEGGKVDNLGGEFPQGTSLKIAATSNQGYKFKDWTGDKATIENPLNLKINTNYNIQANFISNCELEKVILKK